MGGQPPNNTLAIRRHLGRMVKRTKDSGHELQGWREISEFLGLPVAVAQRWAKSGMPVHHGGRLVYAQREELNQWLGKEAQGPARIASETEDLAADLKSSLAEARHSRKTGRKAA
jgi:phage terminase Nu1 subunit (DNA packaging protein)